MISHVFVALAFAGFAVHLGGQEVLIPDASLKAAIGETLQNPNGPLTVQDLLGLDLLSAGGRGIRGVEGLDAARNLRILDLDNNSISNFPIAGALTNLAILDLFRNHLSSFVLSNASPHLEVLDIAFNSLTQCSLPAGMTNLDTLFLHNNQLTNISLPSGLKRLVQMDLRTNNLTSLTLPPEMTNLATLNLDGNPLTKIVLPEPLTESLGTTIAALEGRGVNVFSYPLGIQLTKLQRSTGAFRFGITGPPGVYVVFSSTNLADWTVVAAVNNPLGGIFFTDASTNLPTKKFYLARLQVPSLIPTNLVFVPANTFKLGSSTNELGHRSDEGPQTTVTLTHGFWISKYLVTQRDYLGLIGVNPGGFPGDLDRPVESVSWFAASNYCAQLTEQDLAAGRIPAGTHYRLPTEAEWECAARAGTTTRFYYGDDPGLTNLTNHAWFGANSSLTTHPVGQKIPNAWGLYDMAGNVWEWCQDWYGDYPGGSVADPQGPASNAIGWKVIRGGAWEASELDCRSARRGFAGASPFISDYIIGFRVVLVPGAK